MQTVYKQTQKPQIASLQSDKRKVWFMLLLLGDKLWKTNVVVLDAAEFVPSQECLEVAVLLVNTPKALSLLL